jgi:phosphate transport system substrate-binding protein
LRRTASRLDDVKNNDLPIHGGRSGGAVGRRTVLGGLVTGGLAASLRVRAEGHRITVGGSGSMVGGMRFVADAFGALHGALPGVVVLPALGSRGGLRALAERRIDVALSNFEPKPEHVNQLPVRWVEYARSPFVLAVHSGSNPGPLTATQVAALFSPGAQLRDGLRARPVLRPGDDVDNELIASMSPLIGEALRSAGSQKGMLTAGTDSDAADLIERTPGAFGAVTLAQIVSEKRPLEPLIIDGRQPSLATLRSGAYPYHKRFVAVTLEGAPPVVSRLLEFLRSREGQQALTASGQLPSP